MKLISYYSLLTLPSLYLVSCAPKIIVIDRQSILEAEANGRFPNLEKTFTDRALQKGPKMLDRSELKTNPSLTKNARVLSGDLSHESAR